jgi:hypothetical protein
VIRCSAITVSGERCRGVPIRGSDLCAAHHPQTQARRRAGARRGGRSRGVTEIVDIKAELRDVISEARSGSIERGRAAVLAQLYGVLLRELEVERKIREVDELEARLQALEETHAQRSGGRHAWRA